MRFDESSSRSDVDLRAKKDKEKEVISRELRDLKAAPRSEQTDEWVLVSRLEYMKIPIKDND